jgi:hypothetical protein
MPNEPQNWNAGSYLGAKSFQLQPGSTFALMLVPNGKVSDVWNNPSITGEKQPIFSIPSAHSGKSIGQIADLTGDGTVFAFEDIRVDSTSRWNDKDYNDLIFRIRGAVGEAISVNSVIAPTRDWRSSPIGQQLLSIASEP